MIPSTVLKYLEWWFSIEGKERMIDHEALVQSAA
jgi:hypothetical protein